MTGPTLSSIVMDSMRGTRILHPGLLAAVFCACAVAAFAQSPALKTWYLAEGSTNWLFEEFVLVANPNQAGVDARVTFLRPPVQVGGVLTPQAPIVHTYALPGTSRKTLRLTRDVPEMVGVPTDVSVVVECLEPGTTTACAGDRGIVVERSMYWPRSGSESVSTWLGGHNSMGVSAPATRWYLAEGATSIFDEYILLTNPSTASPAHVNLTFQGQGANRVAKTISRTLLPGTRGNVVPRIEPDTVEFHNASFSTEIVSDVPILAERSLYWPWTPAGSAPVWRGGHESAAIPDTSLDWNFAEGYTGKSPGGQQFETYLLISNPDPVQTAHVEISYYLDPSLAPVVEPDVAVPPQTRFTRWVNSVPGLAGKSFGIRVRGTNAVPIVAERSMYWGTQPADPAQWSAANWVEGHDSPGVPVDSTKWGFAEGTAENGFFTYFQLRNATATDTNVKITFVLEDGTGASASYVLKANSRYTVSLDQFPAAVWGRRFAAFLESVPASGNPVPFVAERAVYWGTVANWLGGHASAGTPWPAAAVIGTPGTPAAAPAPTITSVSPSQGPAAGGTTVTIRGTGFLWPAVTIGGLPAASVTTPIGDPTTLTAVTAAHVVGVVDVVVRNKDGQAATLAGGFTYGTPPTVTSLTPSSGPLTGGTGVFVTGANLVPGQTAVSIGGARAATINWGSPTQILIQTGAIAAKGTYDVVVTNPDGLQATLRNGFTYLDPPPTITGVAPAQGPTAGGTVITIAGANFRPGALVSVGGVAAPVTSLKPAEIVATTGAHAVGVVDVVVTNTDLQSATKSRAFTYGTPVKFAFGDSITVGLVCDATPSSTPPLLYDYTCTTPAPYPATLAGLLAAPVDNSGMQGEVTPAGLARLTSGAPVPPPSLGASHDIVVLMEGTNDANTFDIAKDPPSVVTAALDAIEANLRSMVNFAQAAGKKVVLNTLPPTVPVQVPIPGVDPVYKGAVPAAIQAVNDRIRKIWSDHASDAAFAGADIYAAFMDSTGGHPEGLLSQDGLHPNVAGYDLVAATVRSAMVSRGF